MKLLLDTDTLSASRRAHLQDATFQAFLRAADLASAYLSAVTIAEIRFGIERQRRTDAAFAGILDEWLGRVGARFSGRILPFDGEIADLCGRLATPERRMTADAMIAATALRHGLAVATRNGRHFAPFGVSLIDPWAPGPPLEDMT